MTRDTVTLGTPANLGWKVVLDIEARVHVHALVTLWGAVFRVVLSPVWRG